MLNEAFETSYCDAQRDASTRIYILHLSWVQMVLEPIEWLPQHLVLVLRIRADECLLNLLAEFLSKTVPLFSLNYLMIYVSLNQRDQHLASGH